MPIRAVKDLNPCAGQQCVVAAVHGRPRRLTGPSPSKKARLCMRLCAFHKDSPERSHAKAANAKKSIKQFTAFSDSNTSSRPFLSFAFSLFFLPLRFCVRFSVSIRTHQKTPTKAEAKDTHRVMDHPGRSRRHQPVRRSLSSPKHLANRRDHDPGTVRALSGP